MLLVAGLAVWAPRRHGGRWEVPAARAVALFVLTAWAGEYVADVAEADGEERDTIEDVYEPYLLQLGMLKRTPRADRRRARL
jgi:hypothetical protein